MHCKIHGDLEDGPDLKYDSLLGWLHQYAGFWHTLGGTPLELKNGEPKLRKSRTSDVPALRIELDPGLDDRTGI
jgi:hypothetical protein